MDTSNEIRNPQVSKHPYST